MSDHLPPTETITATTSPVARPAVEKIQPTNKQGSQQGENCTSCQSGAQGHPPNPPPPQPIKTVEINMMAYVDDKGFMRKIYLPKGTASTARRLYAEKRWDDLAKFPAYEKQGYDTWEADGEKHSYLRDSVTDQGQ